jgi:predicted nucleic acid-binding protein
MIFFDSSALVKKYLAEAGSEMVKKILDSSPVFAASKIAFPEIISAFNRKYKYGDISEDELEKAIKNFETDWICFNTVEVKDDLFPIIKRIIKTYALRGADSIHLAAALWLRDTFKENIKFVASDVNLLKAAYEEGLKIVNPHLDK